MTVSSAKGMLLSGMIFDAGATNLVALLVFGYDHGGSATDPSALHDVFFHIGGAEPCKATTSLVVTSDNVILDDIWAWRADHGKGVGWTSNTADIGVIVTGRNVTAYSLFVEHYQKYEVIWRGVCTICSRSSSPRKAPVAFCTWSTTQVGHRPSPIQIPRSQW